MIFLPYIKLIIGLVLLVKCADWFVEGASNLARALGVSGLIVGLTVVAFGTSAPELAVSLSAALSGQNDICVGNVTGSNLCNTLLILGCVALFAPLTTEKQVIRRDFPFMIIAEAVLVLMTLVPVLVGSSQLMIYRVEGIILLALILVYLFKTITDARKTTEKVIITEVFTEGQHEKFKIKDLVYIIVGIAGVVIGGNFVVDSAVEIATGLGLSTHLIALTIVAVGTSLPELVTSVMAAKKGETGITIGNVIGSNIFNVSLITGATATVCPVAYNVNTMIDTICVLAAGIAAYIFVITDNYLLKRSEGVVLILGYISFMIYAIVR